MKKERGVLLAVSSLPGKYGIGDFSTEAIEFIKILKKNNIELWQILPLNPVGYGHSPYQPFSSYAIDEIYISLEDLYKKKLIKKVKKIPSKCKSDFELAKSIKDEAVYQAFESYKKNPNNIRKIESFLKENPYIDEFVEFYTIKEFNNSKSWDEWTISKLDRIEDFKYNKMKHAFAQMMMFNQWQKIKKFANKNGVKIIGDVPFYVGYDSSDVYFHKEAFMLDKENKPTCIAGVPPDYFSEVGQRWGNPIWNWEYLSKNEFKNINDRLVAASNLYDIVRLDHFRGFDSYWSINPSCPTAVDGEWKYPNGYLFFNTLFSKYSNINIIVEDLGDLRPEVLTLKDHFNLSGMRELVFSIFEDEIDNKKVEKENQIYYITTHDNETLCEWISKLDKTKRKLLDAKMNELNVPGECLSEKLIHYSLNRKERIVIVSLSDVLKLNKTHRMNKPGIIDESNWKFKLKDFNKTKAELKKYF